MLGLGLSIVRGAVIISAGSPPGVPQNLVATPGDGFVQLFWDPVSGAEYSVYRDGVLLIAHVSSDGYVDDTVTNGITYSYTVSAVNGAGESDQSDPATATPEETFPALDQLTPTAFWPLGDAKDAATIVDTSGNSNSLTPNLRINDCTLQFRMGRNSSDTSPQQVYGALKGWGKWNRVLTSGEKAALAGGEYWPFSTTTTLQDAQAYYLLDEAGGSSTYADSTTGGNDLTAGGTDVTTRVDGPGGASDHATGLGGVAYLTKTSPPAALRSGQFSMTIAGWVNLDSKPTPDGRPQQVFWGQLNPDSQISGANVYFDPTADRFAFDFDAGDSANLDRGSAILANTLGSPSTGTWYFLICEFDLANNRISISVDNGTADTLGPTLQPEPEAAISGYGSRFRLNPALDFGTQTSGWDTPPNPIGNSYAKKTPNADISIGDNAKTVWGWFKATGTSSYQTLAGMYDATAGGTDWAIQLSAGQLYFIFGREVAYCNVAFTDTTSLHLVVAWFDKDANKIHIDLDHGAATAMADGPGTPQTSSTQFRLGSDTSNSGNSLHQFDGVLWRWGIADGIPSSTDLDALWNSGNGWKM